MSSEPHVELEHRLASRPLSALGVGAAFASAVGAWMVYASLEDPGSALDRLWALTAVILLTGFAASVIALGWSVAKGWSASDARVAAVGGSIGLALVGWSAWYGIHVISLALH